MKMRKTKQRSITTERKFANGNSKREKKRESLRMREIESKSYLKVESLTKA